MSEWTIYHNPRCSKSRETLALLEQNGIKPRIVEYLKNAPSEKELLEILKELPAKELVRTKEEKYLDLNFDLKNSQVVARELHLHPELLERPIVLKGKKAIIGRPPENVKKLF